MIRHERESGIKYREIDGYSHERESGIGYIGDRGGKHGGGLRGHTVAKNSQKRGIYG